ncbi:heterokaryon incompatibility protein-domain-containing protein, partial [Microdochium bolleyi]
MASPFSYDPLRGAQFRLLRLGPAESHDSSASPDTENVSICCDISNHDLDQHPEYTALSYTWGTGEPSKAILLNGTLFPVRDNLYQLWWIDAICINQDDISERSSQVALMRRIYRQASRIVIWLGPAADDSDQA